MRVLRVLKLKTTMRITALLPKTKSKSVQVKQLKSPKKGRSSEESEVTYQFQGPSARSKNWFNLDTECNDDNYLTSENKSF